MNVKTEKSKNIYEDLEYKNPSEMKMKAVFARIISDQIKAQNLTQAQAAKQMKIPQKKVSDIIKGKFQKMSIERLLTYSHALGVKVSLSLEVNLDAMIVGVKIKEID